MKNNNYTVYTHVNKINGKMYVGVTSQKPIYRWKNGLGYKNNRYFFRAIEKHGWNNFKHIILLENLSEMYAKEIEKYLIHKYNTANPKNGYNISLGGDGTLGYRHTDEAKQKISEKNLGHATSQKTRKLIGQASSKKVAQFSKINGELLSVFNSLKEAEKISKIDSRHISRCCVGKRKSTGGFCWMHYDDYVENGFNKDLLQNSSYRKVLCIETNEIFNTILEASISKNINNVGIWNCCNNLAKTAGGFIWKYAD